MEIKMLVQWAPLVLELNDWREWKKGHGTQVQHFNSSKKARDNYSGN